MFVSILIDETCAMWIDSSSLPIHCGLKSVMLVGVIMTCAGKMRLPRAQPAGAEHVIARQLAALGR